MSDAAQPATPSLVLLFDVDNTLLDNDRLKSDLAAHLLDLVGPDRSTSFWRTYEEVRLQVKYVDYPTTITRWSVENQDRQLAARVQQLFDQIDFPSYLYPGALDVLAHCARFGTTAVLSDGDHVFQPKKIAGSGIAEAVGDRVVITVHKQEELDEVYRRYPADHYVMIDDKAKILSLLRQCCPVTFTTVHVLQGHYAYEVVSGPKPDREIAHIDDLLNFSRDDFLPEADLQRGRQG